MTWRLRGSGRFRAILVLAVLAAGCSSVPQRTPVPEPLMDEAAVPGIPFNGRFWGDGLPPWMEDMQAQVRKVASGPNRPSAWDEPQRYLAISGGGPDGAFGAGLLNGWTAAGDRPEFTIVTGISTGALTAPFAFLGPDYDPVLKEIYTTYATDDLVEPRTWLGIVTGDAAADTAPLFALIERYLDDEAIAKIAAANADGRRLFIGTTNLDAGRPMLWNITAIAASDAPEKARLIHEILLASASIPGAFPPVLFEVDAEGQRYQELHVDGGATSQVFLYPAALDFREVLGAIGAADTAPRAYVIRNSPLSPHKANVEPPNIFQIAGKSVSSLIRTQGIGSIYAIYLGARRDGIDFNLAYIPETFDVEATEPFDPVYMKALFEVGYELAKSGYPWVKVPPTLDPPQVETPPTVLEASPTG
jgi:predicted acylesterase/phospholipase RssA